LQYDEQKNLHAQDFHETLKKKNCRRENKNDTCDLMTLEVKVKR